MRLMFVMPMSKSLVPPILFMRRTFRDELRLRAADRDPKRCKEIPEANTRQRDAPPGAFVLCRSPVLSSGRGTTIFRETPGRKGR